MFGELTTEASFTRIEEEVRRFWRRHDVPQAALAACQDGPSCLIHQQPLVTAGQPWSDQVRLVAVADLLARYRTMRGDAVQRRTGWASHGLTVEVAVERLLGAEVADYNLARFNAACREAAKEGKRQGEALVNWLGAWLDPGNTYDTLRPEAIGIIWRMLWRLWDAGRLKRELRVVPVCPRCATPLSEAETTRHAREVEASSVWLRLPWDGEPHAYLLTWTPTSWALVGMVALAVHPDASYVLVEMERVKGNPPERLLLAEAALGRTPLGPHRLVRKMVGKALRGARYRPPFTFLPIPEGIGRVVLSEAVPLDQGTGLLPVMPAFDGLSLALAKAQGLMVPDLVDDGGKLNDTVTPWRGLSPLESEPYLVGALGERGLLVRKESRRQLHAICPYCETLLLPQARDVWLAETASGPWILGRDRAWGVPLPVWVCASCGRQSCIAGLDDLAHKAGLETNQIDPYRPAVDGLTLPCTECGGTMYRARAVMDAAFEAAVLPWATAPQPDPTDRAVDPLDKAQGSRAQRTLAVGLGDEHIGWLGDLTELAALLRGSLAWEQAVALPERETERFQDLAPTTPADALRWAVYTGTTPDQAERNFLRLLWQLTFPASALAPSVADQPESPPHLQGKLSNSGSNELLDRWWVARLHQTITTLAEALDACEPQRAATIVAELVQDISEWYVPLRPGGEAKILEPLSRLLAPFVPHLAEAIHRRAGERRVESVHLADWPPPQPAMIDEALLSDVALVRRLTVLGQTARDQADAKPDQPVRRALVYVLEKAAEPERVEALLADTLGVTHVELSTGKIMDQVRWRLALNRKRAAKRGMAPVQIDAALSALDPEAASALVSQLWDGLSVGLDVSGRAITLLPDEVRVSVQAPPGWAAAAEAGCLILLEVNRP